ncbi:MAG TPA: hypothetical protein VN615_07945 [Gaiellales bacterium]|nr:hypothetical protein [Gaiellales bacterium]
MNVRMIRADLLRLRKHRGLFWWSIVLTSGAVAAFYGIALGFHLHDPAQYGPAGGVENLRRGLWVLSMVGGVGAAIVGATAGTADTSSGVFRDLVVTGRSRVGLFAARAAGAVAFWVPLAVAAYATLMVLTFGLAAGTATPTLAAIAKDGAWVVAVTTVTLLAGLGVSATIGSRGISIGVLLGWQLAVSQVLENVHVLGVTREALLTAAAGRLEPFTGDAVVVPMSAAAAVVAMAGWALLPLVAGAWRTRARDA